MKRILSAKSLEILSADSVARADTTGLERAFVAFLDPAAPDVGGAIEGFSSEARRVDLRPASEIGRFLVLFVFDLG